MFIAKIIGITIAYIIVVVLLVVGLRKKWYLNNQSHATTYIFPSKKESEDFAKRKITPNMNNKSIVNWVEKNRIKNK